MNFEDKLLLGIWIYNGLLMVVGIWRRAEGWLWDKHGLDDYCDADGFARAIERHLKGEGE